MPVLEATVAKPLAHLRSVKEPGSSRIVFIDLARVAAILFMIQGHTLDVLLAPQYRVGAMFNIWLFLRGLTAPLFFALSGASFTIASIRSWEKYAQLSPQVWRRISRFLFFVLLGYAMHLPSNSFSNFQYVTPEGWRSWFQVDVLQCIGLTLIVLQILILLSRTPQNFARCCAVLCGLVILGTPVAWAMNWTRWLPAQIAPYLSAQTGSFFPLFPWAGFVFLGAVLGYILRSHVIGLLNVSGVLALASLFLVFCGILSARLSVAVYAGLDFWRTSPAAFLIRSGCVCILLAGFSYATDCLRIPERLCRSIAEESLLIYFLHICILYGSIWNLDFNMRQALGSNSSPAQSFFWIVLLSLTMLLIGWLWNSLKRLEPRRSYAVRFAVFALALFRVWS